MAPVIPILAIVKAPGPLLVKVTLCAVLVEFVVWFANVSDVGDSITVGTGATPVPERLMVCGLPLPLSAMLTDAVRVPVAVGVNVTLIAQDPLVARVAGLSGQVFV